jgi:hypothetical protein
MKVQARLSQATTPHPSKKKSSGEYLQQRNLLYNKMMHSLPAYTKISI